jgi:hypothetical protein
MTDAGPASDYFGPYSPYFHTHFAADRCVHLFTCPACGSDRRMAIRLKII